MRNLMILAAIAAPFILNSCDFFTSENHQRADNPIDTTQKVSIEEIDTLDAQEPKVDTTSKAESDKVKEEPAPVPSDK